MKNAFIIYTGFCINPQMWIFNETRSQYFLCLSQSYINCNSRDSSVSSVNMLQVGGSCKICLTSGNSKRHSFLRLLFLRVNCKINETITVNRAGCFDGIIFILCISPRLRGQTGSEYSPACSPNVSGPQFMVTKRPVLEDDDS